MRSNCPLKRSGSNVAESCRIWEILAAASPAMAEPRLAEKRWLSVTSMAEPIRAAWKSFANGSGRSRVTTVASGQFSATSMAVSPRCVPNSKTRFAEVALAMHATIAPPLNRVVTLRSSIPGNSDIGMAGMRPAATLISRRILEAHLRPPFPTAAPRNPARSPGTMDRFETLRRGMGGVLLPAQQARLGGRGYAPAPGGLPLKRERYIERL